MRLSGVAAARNLRPVAVVAVYPAAGVRSSQRAVWQSWQAGAPAPASVDPSNSAPWH